MQQLPAHAAQQLAAQQWMHTHVSQSKFVVLSRLLRYQLPSPSIIQWDLERVWGM